MSCGAKFKYSLNKPNFCASCGSPLGEEIAKASVNEVVEEKEPPGNESPTLSKLEYTINKASQGQTFGDLISEASRDTSSEYAKAESRPKPSYNPKENIVKTTMNQCRSSRNPEDLGGQEN
jgi:hypothetical protein